MAFAVWLLMTIDGLLPRVQAAILGGRVVVPNIALKPIFLGLLLGTILYGRSLTIPWQLRVAYCLFLTYLTVDALSLFFVWPPHSLLYLLFGYDAYYFFLIALGLFALTARTLRENLLARTMFLVFLPLGAFGVLQYAMNSPLLPLETGSGQFSYGITSYAFFHQMRAVSLFSNSWEFGAFASLIACIALSNTLSNHGGKRILWAGALATVLPAIYCTLTRTVYLETLLGFSSIILISFACSARGRKGLLNCLPIAYGLCTAALALFLGPLVGSASRTITSDQTLLGRLQNWSVYFHTWTEHSLWRFLFGTGVIQNTHFLFSRNVVIDNTYLAIAVEIGFVGLVLWFYLMWRVWRYFVDETLRSPTAMRIALAGFFSTWLATGTFAIVIGPFAIVPWLFIAVDPERLAVPSKAKSALLNRPSRGQTVTALGLTP
jgi:O-antigen ligase